MSDNEKELRRIMNHYVELSAYHMERALEEYKIALTKTLEIYEQKYNDNSK